MWDAFRLGEPLPDFSALARGWPPTPTPPSGRASKASRVTLTSRERPLVTSSPAERLFTASAATAAAASAATSAQATSTIRRRRPIPTTATANVTTKSATKLDREYEQKSPQKRNAAAAAAATYWTVRPRRSRITTSSTTIGTIR